MLPLLHGVLELIPSKTDSIPSTTWAQAWQVKAGRAGVQGHLRLHRLLKARLGCIRPCLQFYHYSTVPTFLT